MDQVTTRCSICLHGNLHMMSEAYQLCVVDFGSSLTATKKCVLFTFCFWNVESLFEKHTFEKNTYVSRSRFWRDLPSCVIETLLETF